MSFQRIKSILVAAACAIAPPLAHSQVVFYTGFESVDSITQDTILVSPQVEIPPGSGINLGDIQVSSLFSDDPEVDLAADTLLVGERNGQTVLLGFASEGDRFPTLSARTTVEVLAVLWLGLGADYNLRQQLRQAIVGHPDYESLVELVLVTYRNDATFLDRLAEYPTITGSLNSLIADVLADYLAEFESRSISLPRPPTEANKTFPFYSPWDDREPWDWYGTANLFNVVGQSFLAVPSKQSQREEVVATANPRLTTMALQLFDSQGALLDWRIVPRSSSLLGLFAGSKLRNSGAAYRELQIGTLFPPNTDHIEFRQYINPLNTETENGRLQVSILNTMHIFGAVVGIYSAVTASGIDDIAETLAENSNEAADYFGCVGLAALQGGVDLGISAGTSAETGLLYILENVIDLATLLFEECKGELVVAIGSGLVDEVASKAVAGAVEIAVRIANPGAWITTAFKLGNQVVPFALSLFEPGFAGYRLTWQFAGGQRTYVSNVERNDERPSGLTPIVPAFSYTSSSGREVSLNATESVVDRTQAPMFSWDFGDGLTGLGEVTSHIFEDPGTYSVQLEVSDAEQSAMIAKNIVVTEGSAPVIDSLSCSLDEANPMRVLLTSSVIDSDGDHISNEWRLERAQKSPELITSASEQSVILEFPTDQVDYQPMLTAIDSEGLESSAFCVVTTESRIEVGANPNPVLENTESIVIARVTENGTSVVGKSVTFSTDFPGVFLPGSVEGEISAVTDNLGTARVSFLPSEAGTANIIAKAGFVDSEFVELIVERDVPPLPSLDLMITSSLDPVQDGTALTFTMTLSNPSLTETQTNVVLEAVIPSHMLIGPAADTSPAGTCTDGGSSCGAGEVIRWSLGSLMPGEARVVRFSDVVGTGAAEGELLTAQATVIANGVSAVQDSLSVVVSEDGQALQLALSAGQNPAAPGDLVAYQLRFTNRSAVLTANNLTATLPAGVTFISADEDGVEADGVVSWPISIGPGVDGSREFTVQLDSGLTSGALLRTEAGFDDTNSGVGATAADVLAVNDMPSLDLMITSSLDPVQDGTALTFTMTLSNPSLTETQTNVVLEAVIPSHMLIGPAADTSPAGTCTDGGSSCGAGEVIRWSLGSLMPGEARVVRFSDVVGTGAAEGELLTAQATVIANGVSAVQDSLSVVVSEDGQALQLALSAGQNPAAPGDLVAYQLRFTNRSAVLTANNLTATLPAGVTFISADEDGVEADGVVSWPISIGPGVDGSREFTVQLDSGLTSGALLRTEAGFDDTNSGVGATAADVLAVNDMPSLDLMITSSLDPVQDGTALTFTMTLSNPSLTETQTNVVLEAVIPSHMLIGPAADTSPAGTCTDGGSSCGAGEVIRWSLGSLMPGEARVVRFSDVVGTGAAEGELLTAQATVIANGVSAVQDSLSVVVSEDGQALQLALSAGQNPAAPGDLVAYQLRFTNRSAVLTANNLTATLPAGVTFISADEDGVEADGVVSWPISIGPGVDGSREFTVQLDSGLTSGALLRTEAGFDDTNSGVGATAADVLAVNDMPSLDLMITSSLDPVQDGTALTFTMTLSNPSLTETQTNVVLEAVIPSHMLIGPAADTSPAGTCTDGGSSCGAGEVIRWSLGSLMPGEARVVRLTENVGTGAAEGELITLAATGNADGTGSAEAELTIAVSEDPP